MGQKIKAQLEAFYWQKIRKLFNKISGYQRSISKWVYKIKTTFFICVAFLVCAFATIYLLFANNIEKESVFTDIVLAWISAIVTISGIAWTLNSSQKENAENHRLSIRPYIVYGLGENETAIRTTVKLLDPDLEDEYFMPSKIEDVSNEVWTKINKYQNFCAYRPVDIHVADYAEGILRAIFFEEKECFLHSPVLLKKNTSYRLLLGKYVFIKKKQNIRPTIKLCIQDMRGYSYVYDIGIDDGNKKILNLKNTTRTLHIYNVTGCDTAPEGYGKKSNHKRKNISMDN